MLPFRGCRDRIERAQLHRDAFAKVWNNFVESDVYDIVIDLYGDGAGAIRIIPEPMPTLLSLELGEMLYHLRSALDGMVWEAAAIQTGKNPPPNENRLEFPICASREEFQRAGWKIEPLSEKLRGFIEAVQPYNAPELADHLVVYNVNRTLAILNDWARKDRHRQLHFVGSWVASANPKIEVPLPARVASISVTGSGFLDHENVLAEFFIEGYHPGLKVRGNPDLAIDVGVNEPPPPAADNDILTNRVDSMFEAVRFILMGIDKECLRH